MLRSDDRECFGIIRILYKTIMGKDVTGTWKLQSKFLIINIDAPFNKLSSLFFFLRKFYPHFYFLFRIFLKLKFKDFSRLYSSESIYIIKLIQFFKCFKFFFYFLLFSFLSFLLILLCFNIKYPVIKIVFFSRNFIQFRACLPVQK